MKKRIGFSDGFFNALTRLQPNIQAKVNQLVLKFQTDTTSAGMNFEKLSGLKDKNMHSLRVDQAYRVILAAPEHGNVYLFLWVDHHDKAYQWVAGHQCKVNPNTGAIQLYSTIIETKSTSAAEQTTAQTKAFDELKDRQLLKLGIPDEQLSLVRTVATEADLDAIQNALPCEVYEALFMYLAGESYEDILRDMALDETEVFDTSNFAAALERVQTMARFVEPADDNELSEMLNAPMEKWRVFLHPSQRKLAEGNKNGAVRVLGGAGTGKTVVAMHRARWLARQLDVSNKKILFTTFTKNLAVDIKKNLESICGEEINRIEVVNLDQWVQRFLRKRSYDYEVVFDEKYLEDFWRKAISEKPVDISFSDNFFKEEWQKIIQPQGIKTLNDYKKASRIGRGTRLNRAQRVNIWPVFEEYRYQLNRARIKEVDDAYRDAADLISNEKLDLPYASIIVDEAQDMGTQAFRLLRALVPEGSNDLFIVGDAHQRIYGRNRVVLGQCGINIRGRSSKLKINYRTTDEIRRWAVNLLAGCSIDDLDGEDDNNSLYKSLTHGQAPMIEQFESADDQAGFIKAFVDKSEEPNSHTCVVARTNKEVLAIQQRLDGLGVKTAIIKPNEPEPKDTELIKLATVHRVKGLEFDHVILASANEGLIPLDILLKDKADITSIEETETEERSLVYVAITRARRSAFVLNYGMPSIFFRGIEVED